MSLEIRNLTKKFGEKIIFSNFSFSFPDKGIFALVGDSGIGKTTLLRMISGLDTDFNGEITGGGLERTSFAFQEYRLFPYLSLLDNLVFAVSDDKDGKTLNEAAEILFSLGLSRRDINKFPKETSGGMKQRASIGRSLMKECPILLLDEPTKELDSENVELVLDAIQKEAQKRLVIVVTHRIEDIQRLCAKIIEIK